MNIQSRGPTPRHIRRHLRRLLKESWIEVAKFWHRRMRPKHFTAAGAREYGYVARKGEGKDQRSKAFKRSYTGRKKREKGHVLPLVWSGRSRNRSRLRDIRATSRGVKIVLHTPTLNFKNPKSKIQMATEMTKVSVAEWRVLTRLFDTILNRKLREINDVTTRRVA